MGKFLNLIALLLIVFWAIGLLAYGAGFVIHLVLLLAVILLAMRMIQREKSSI